MPKGTTGTGLAVDRNLRPKTHPVKGNAVALVLILAYTAILSGCAGLVSGNGGPSGNPQGQTAFQLNPANVNFGSVAMGQKVSQQASVTNTGTTPINITALTVSSNEFSVSGATAPLSLGVGQGANFSVWFNSAAVGKSAGTLTVQADGGAAPAVINLSGTANATGPQLALSSSNLDLGTATVNTKVSSSVTLSNTGNADLTISVITVNGSAFGVSGIATPKTITAGQSTTMTVNFSPTTAGAASGNILLTSNDASGTATIILSGTGTASATGHLAANPASLSFGNVAVGSNNTLSTTVTNTGQATVNISQVQVAGAAFSATGITVPTSLSVGQSGTLQVKFAPASTGSVTGSVSLVSDAPGSPLTINLSGAGTQSSLSLSPASLSFGSVVDGVSKTQQLTVSNNGGTTVVLSQVAFSGPGFSISGIATPLTLSIGQSKSFTVQFAPQTAGDVTGSVVLTSDAANSPSSVSLSGTGIAATITMSASPSALNFGSINAGTATTQNLTVSNTGNSNVTISQINVTAKDVTWSGATLPATLAPAQTLGLTVQFKPLAVESVSGNITITNQGTSTAVSVTGSGVQGALTTTPTSIAFGSVVTGVSNSQPVQMTNTGTASVTISQVNTTGAGFSTTGLTPPLVLAAGQSSSFSVFYAPQTAGSVTGSVTLISDAPNTPNILALSGTGVTATRTLSVSQSSLSFGNVNTGASASQTLTFTNTGNTNVTILGITESGAAFSLGGAATPVVLTPAQGTTITVNFNPTVAGNASGNITVISDATGSPANIPLSGNGVTVTPHSVLLTWGASPSVVSGYFIYRSTTNGSGYTKLNPAAPVPTLTYTDAAIQNSQTYYYVATAVDAGGIESNYSNQVQIVVP